MDDFGPRRRDRLAQARDRVDEQGLLPRQQNDRDEEARARRSVCIYTLDNASYCVYLYTHEVERHHQGPEIGWLGTSRPEGQPCSVQAPNQSWPRDRPAPEQGRPNRDT